MKFICAIVLFAFICVALSQTSGQEIGRLYAARPPVGSTFVRVAAGAESATLNVNIGALPSGEIEIGRSQVATRYRAVDGAKLLSIVVDGLTLEKRFQPRPNQFLTVVVLRDGPRLSAYTIDEGEGGSNDLKAQLRFFNIASGCDAALKVVGGPTVFEATPSRAVRSRAINPVKADLEAICSGGSATFMLPQLRPGDHFSVFLRGAAGGAISLSGQFDETEPHRGH